MPDLRNTVTFFSAALLSLTMWFAGSAAAQLPDFKDIVEKKSPAVVKIIVEQGGDDAQSLQQMIPEEIPEYLRRFFEFRGRPPADRMRRSMGSGFIISADGYVLTNYHVVENAESVLVRLIDRQEFDAEIVGMDQRSDLALLRIDAQDLPYLTLAGGEELEVGEWVVAIGSPFGLDYSVTAGIVSAKGRSLPTEDNENYVPFIQTDVAINPGNSGGPLFNLRGEVVGVNSQIYTRSGGSIGLSFAIPSSVVEYVVGQLKTEGRVTRGWLGVAIQNVDRNLAESFGLDRPHGALVAEVMPDSPAERAGFKSGDVIVAFDGRSIEESADLPHVVGMLQPGRTVQAKVVRDGRTRRISVEIGRLDTGEDTGESTDGDGAGGYGGRVGVVVESADQSVLERWGLSGGVVVREVIPGSPAAEAGVQPGDVITLIGSTAVNSAESFRRAEEELEAGASVPVRLIRRGSPRFLGLKLQD